MMTNGNGLVRSAPVRRTALLAGAIIAAALAAAAFVLNRPPDDLPAQAEPALTVVLTTPRPVTWPTAFPAQGVVAAWEEASIGAQIGSYQLVDIRVNVGDEVRRGQVLARLNPALIEAERAQALAQFDQARADDMRATGLREVGGISDQEALRFATEARTAGAVLAGKDLELRYTMIRAPDDGVISSRAATLGTVVPAGQELFRMVRQGRLEWRGELTAAQLATVSKGDRIALRLPDGSGGEAIVRQTAPVLDARTRLGLVFADLVPGSGARAGMYASGNITTGSARVLAIPAECIVVRDGYSLVVEVVGSGPVRRVAMRRVTTGQRRGKQIAILQGLAGRETLVLRGAAFLQDGDSVRVAGAAQGLS